MTNCPLRDTTRRICNDRLRSHFGILHSGQFLADFYGRKDKKSTCDSCYDHNVWKTKGNWNVFDCSTRKKQKQTTFISTENRKTRKRTSHYDRFWEFHFSTLILRQLEKKRTNLRLDKFLISTTRI